MMRGIAVAGAWNAPSTCIQNIVRPPAITASTNIGPGSSAKIQPIDPATVYAAMILNGREIGELDVAADHAWRAG